MGDEKEKRSCQEPNRRRCHARHVAGTGAAASALDEGPRGARLRARVRVRVRAEATRRRWAAGSLLVAPASLARNATVGRTCSQLSPKRYVAGEMRLRKRSPRRATRAA